LRCRLRRFRGRPIRKGHRHVVTTVAHTDADDIGWSLLLDMLTRTNIVVKGCLSIVSTLCFSFVCVASARRSIHDDSVTGAILLFVQTFILALCHSKCVVSVCVQDRGCSGNRFVGWLLPLWRFVKGCRRRWRRFRPRQHRTCWAIKTRRSNDNTHTQCQFSDQNMYTPSAEQ